jgi:ABC-type glutathione transport system ATPase component
MAPLIQVENLSKRYDARGSSGGKVVALDGVNFSLEAGTTLAILGASGSGKSTLAKCMTCLEKQTSGRIVFDGQDLTALRASELRSVRTKIQLVFQDPALSLNPRFTAFDAISEPWQVERNIPQSEWSDRAAQLMKVTGLSTDFLQRKPMQLSGGQRQRLAIARALAAQPKVLILDEALSSLDLPVQAQIANLLMELKESRGLTMIFITHDPAMAGHIADKIAVMSEGRIVEEGSPREIVCGPQTSATKALLSAMPGVEPGTQQAVDC